MPNETTSQRPPGRDRLALPGLLLIALLVRLAAAFLLPGDPHTYDSRVYLAMAEGILDENPASSFPNGYPLLIALFDAALPGHLLTPALLLLNALLGTAAVGLIYAVARWFLPRPYALGVGMVAALYPHQAHYTRLVMTETLCTFLLALAAYLLLKPVYAPRSDTAAKNSDADDLLTAGVFLSGCLFHYAAAVRPSVNLVFPIVLLAALLCRVPKKWPALLAAGYAVSFLLFFGLEKIGVTRPPAAAANNMLIAITSDSRSVVFKQFPPEERARALSTYLRFAASQPAKFASQRAISLWELWGFWSLPGGYRAEAETGLVRLMVLFRFFLLLLGLAGAARRLREFATWVLLAPVVSITVLHVAAFSNHRFVVPAEPFLFVLAAFAVSDWAARPRARRG